MIPPQNPFSSFACPCGRVWQFEQREPSGRKETLACRCGSFIATSDDGSLDAELLSPREGWAIARTAAYRVGLCALVAASKLRVPLQQTFGAGLIGLQCLRGRTDPFDLLCK